MAFQRQYLDRSNDDDEICWEKVHLDLYVHGDTNFNDLYRNRVLVFVSTYFQPNPLQQCKQYSFQDYLISIDDLVRTYRGPIEDL